jgi:hypothetical protein
LQHKIKIQDESKSVSQLTGDYKKGYDRLSNGLAMTGFIGYQHLDPKKRINFITGFDLTMGFTQNRRDFNFDTMTKDERKRKDFLVGFKVGWILPISTGENPEEIFY